MHLDSMVAEFNLTDASQDPYSLVRTVYKPGFNEHVHTMFCRLILVSTMITSVALLVWLLWALLINQK